MLALSWLLSSKLRFFSKNKTIKRSERTKESPESNNFRPPPPLPQFGLSWIFILVVFCIIIIFIYYYFYCKKTNYQLAIVSPKYDMGHSTRLGHDLLHP